MLVFYRDEAGVLLAEPKLVSGGAGSWPRLVPPQEESRFYALPVYLLTLMLPFFVSVMLLGVLQGANGFRIGGMDYFYFVAALSAGFAFPVGWYSSRLLPAPEVVRGNLRQDRRFDSRWDLYGFCYVTCVVLAAIEGLVIGAMMSALFWWLAIAGLFILVLMIVRQGKRQDRGSVYPR